MDTTTGKEIKRERICLIQGLEHWVEACDTDECPLHRYKICRNREYKYCFSFDEWSRMSGSTKDSIKAEQVERVSDANKKHALMEELNEKGYARMMYYKKDKEYRKTKNMPERDVEIVKW